MKPRYPSGGRYNSSEGPIVRRSGFADLPLHGGRVPGWLAERMKSLGVAIVEAIVHHYGTAEFLSRLSDPFWFQALGAVMGMDWHSSGITTSVLGALKRGVNPRSHELGIYICGGRGNQSRRTPDELLSIADRTGIPGDTLVRNSRLMAKIDNNAIGDGFQLYLHTFIVTAAGDWAVVQQGLNDATGLARRYHWHSASVRDFTCEPHTAIVGQSEGTILNLVDRRALPAQDALLHIARQRPDVTVAEARRLIMPRRHEVDVTDVDLERLGAVLAVSYERELRDFASLLLTEKLGPRALQTLSLVAEVVHGTPTRFSDPARFSFSLGGKDGHPFPVPLKTYDESLSFLRTALDRAKAGDTDKIDGFRRLDRLVQAVGNRLEPRADFHQALAHERALSPSLGGRTVMGDSRARRKLASRQLSLFE